MDNDQDNYRRKSDDMIVELNTRFNDFVENYKAMEKERIEWRNKFEEKVETIDDRTKTMLIPYRISLWTFTIVGGGLLVEACRRMAEFFKDHIHFR